MSDRSHAVSTRLLERLAAYTPQDRLALILGRRHDLPLTGAAMIADLSGFTTLTESLAQKLSPARGAEEMTRALNSIFTPLVERVHEYHGAVMKFAGDALLVWYGTEEGERPKDTVLRAITSAWKMQEAIAVCGVVATPAGEVTMRMKIGVHYGPVKRFALGQPDIGLEDTQVGRTLDLMSAAEHHAEPGDIVLTRPTWRLAKDLMDVRTWRQDFAVIERPRRLVEAAPWPAVDWTTTDQEAMAEQLAAYVPQQVYETLALGDIPVAELKPVISLFVQFHGLAYDEDPNVGDKLQTYFSQAQRVVARYDGRVNRLVTGDKGSLLHVIFGAPRVVEDQAERAARCALDLQAMARDLDFITMQRIGVATGRSYSGPVGSATRNDYTTMGDSINLSARLMQNAADDQILVGEGVRKQLGPEIILQDLGEITVKGKAEPLPVYAALGARRQAEETPTSGAMPLFGRADVWATLSARVQELAGGVGGVVVLRGRVGAGKTYVMEALRRQAQGDDFLWAKGMGLAYGETLAGYLVIDLLRDLAALPAESDPAATARSLEAFALDLFGPARRDGVYPYLASLMGLQLTGADAQRLQGLSGESVRWQSFEIVRELTRRLARRRPIVLVLDDLQWVDPTSQQVISMLLPLTHEVPLLMLMAMRPEQESRGWALRDLALTESADPGAELVLADLDPDAARDLLLYHAPELSAVGAERLVQRLGGNPLYLAETARMLRMQGFFENEHDWETVDLDQLSLPDSVQGLLLAQIDRLALESRHTLQMASVIGPQFLYKVLESIGAGQAQLEAGITDLAEREQILEDDSTAQGPCYFFRHVLIQESAYDTLLFETRRHYHHEVASVLERLFPQQAAEQAALLAYHFERAGELDKAITYHISAADQARLLYANEEAEALYKQALAVMDELEEQGGETDLERRAKTYMKAAQVRSQAFDFMGAQTYYELAFELFDEIERNKPPAADDGHERIFRSAVLEHGPLSLDPGLSEIKDMSEIVNDLFEGLLELDNDMNVMPALARRWRVSEGGKRYDFELKPDLRWSDGAPLTAHDFVFAWRRNLSPETDSGRAPNLYPVKGAENFHQGENSDPGSIGIRALDDLHLEIDLEFPVSYFPFVLTDAVTYPLPAHVLQAHGLAWSQPENIVCNGPFVIEHWEDKVEILLRCNPLYRGFMPGNLDYVSLRYVEPLREHFQAGLIDWYRSHDQFEEPAPAVGQSILLQEPGTFFIAFSCAYPPFDQALVRKAFARSIDRETLLHEVQAETYKPAFGGVVPPGIVGHSPEIGLRFDPETARRHLRDAGYENGQGIQRLKLATLPLAGPTTRFLQKSWETHLGVNVEIIDDGTVKETLVELAQGSVHMAFTGVVADYPDPDNILRFLFHGGSPTNYWGWKHTEFDQLVDGAAVMSDQEQRLSSYHQAEKILVAEEAGVVPLYHMRDSDFLRSGYHLENTREVLQGTMFKFKHIVAQ